MLKSKKALVMSVLCAVASAGFVASASAADTTMQGDLDEIIIEGSRNAVPKDSFGNVITEQSYARTGGDVTVVTRQEIESKHYQNITDAVKRVPGVHINDMGYRGANMDFRLIVSK